MKAKSRLKSKRDVETPEKYLSDDSQGNNLDSEYNNHIINKNQDSYTDLKITDESLKEYCRIRTSESVDDTNSSSIVVRHRIPLENIKQPSKKICVLKKAPSNVPAIPSSSLLDQNNLRFDHHNRPVQHSILGTVDDYFKMGVKKKKFTLKDLPSEYHHILDQGSLCKPFSIENQPGTVEKGKENVDHSNSNTQSKSAKLVPDFDTNALRLWEQRMEERKKLQDHISKKVQRVPEMLIFNSAEGFRETLERRYMISKGIPFHGSGYGFRTGSEFWQQNEEVGIDPEDCLYMTNTQTEKGYPPPILHIGVTNKIKEEKGVPTTKNESEKNNQYHEKRRRELNDVICELDPFQPEFAELMIVGNQIKENSIQNDHKSLSSNFNEESKMESSISEHLSRSETIHDSERIHHQHNGPCLFINSVKLGSKSESQVDMDVRIRMLFNGYAKEKCVEALCLQNKGTSIVRYWWKRLDSYDPFNLENKNIRKFYFNTEDGILLPNQEVNYPIIFKSETSGIFSEVWKIETLPLLIDGKDIIISFKGVALQKDLLASLRKNIDIYMKDQTADTICRNILNDIIQEIDKKVHSSSQDDIDMNSEKDRFNEKNKEIKYSIENINNFKKINQEIFEKESENCEDWDMDCGKLKRNILSAKSMKSVKKEEICLKLYKNVDKAVIPPLQSSVGRQDKLYRICYRHMLDFFGQMYDSLNDIRKYHELPEIEMRISSDKKRSGMSRQRTNNSQTSKKQTSASTSKSKSKEASSLNREGTETLLSDLDDTDKIGSLNNLDIDEATGNEGERLRISLINSNVAKYRFKSHQTVYSLLDKMLSNIIEYWDEISDADI